MNQRSLPHALRPQNHNLRLEGLSHLFVARSRNLALVASWIVIEFRGGVKPRSLESQANPKTSTPVFNGKSKSRSIEIAWLDRSSQSVGAAFQHSLLTASRKPVFRSVPFPFPSNVSSLASSSALRPFPHVSASRSSFTIHSFLHSSNFFTIPFSSFEVNVREWRRVVDVMKVNK